jgi:HprK-related kinase B
MADLLNDLLSLHFPYTFKLNLNGLGIQLHLSDAKLESILVEYFRIYVDNKVPATIHIHGYQGSIKLPDFPFRDKDPEPNKAQIKEEYYDTESFRVVRKKLTHMVYFFDEHRNFVFGDCLNNANQVINFVNNRYIQWKLQNNSLLFHASGVALGESGLALSGFSGMGKSTLALHMMDLGFDFVSNDRLLIHKTDGSLVMDGLVKYPRINPGTILNNPMLESIIPEQKRRELSLLDPSELRKLEQKYDVILDKLYGEDRFHLSAKLTGLVVLNWDWHKIDVHLKKINLRNHSMLLQAFMKTPGLFYYSGKSYEQSEERYISLLDTCPVYVVEGGVNFKNLAITLKQIVDSSVDN